MKGDYEEALFSFSQGASKGIVEHLHNFAHLLETSSFLFFFFFLSFFFFN